MKSALRAREYRYVQASLEGPAAERMSGGDAGGAESRLRAALGSWLAAFFGAKGWAEAGPKFVSYDARARRMLLRCARGREMELCAALSLCSRLENGPAHLRPLRISGTIAGIARKVEEDGPAF